MDLWTIIKVVVRRWYAVLPVLVLTAFLAYEIAYKAPPSYQASGSALLVAPNVATGATGLPVKQNPYLLFSGSLNITASALVRVLNDTAVRGELIEDQLRGDFEIGVEQSTPTIGVTATGPTPEVVVATVRRLLAEIEDRLDGLQNAADAPADLRIGTEFLVNPTSAETLRGEVARTMATIGVLGLLAGVGLALLLEAAVTARRRSKAERRARRQAAAEQAEAAEAAEAEAAEVAAGAEAGGAMAGAGPGADAVAVDAATGAPAGSTDGEGGSTATPAAPAADLDDDEEAPSEGGAADEVPAPAAPRKRAARRPKEAPAPPAPAKRAPRRMVRAPVLAGDTVAAPGTNGSHPPAAGGAGANGQLPAPAGEAGAGTEPGALEAGAAAGTEPGALEAGAAGGPRRTSRRKRSE